MTKEEKIKEAYGAYYEDIKHKISDQGWVNENVISRCFFSDLEFNELTNSMRPLSLKGIENNNRWIKIESEDELPKDSSNYWVWRSDERVSTIDAWHTDKSYFFPYLKVTHYQPIQKPKPPIY